MSENTVPVQGQILITPYKPTGEVRGNLCYMHFNPAVG